jgi:hypothetical protein
MSGMTYIYQKIVGAIGFFEYDYDTHEHDYDTHDCDLYTHELNFNTMRLTLTRTN